MHRLLLLLAAAWLLPAAGARAQGDPLAAAFDLAGARLQAPQYYLMETRVVRHAADGTRERTDVYRFALRYEPPAAPGAPGHFVCTRFTLQLGEAAPVELPSLQGWRYAAPVYAAADAGPVLGIPHEPFDGIAGGDGQPLAAEQAYMTYNSFIDFHAFLDVFAAPTAEGPGIQELAHVGDRVVHAAAFSEPPVDLGRHVAEGSHFKNGEITLTFKGLTRAGGARCALVGFDSGASAFTMKMRPMPGMEVATTGSSHYFGDLYVDLSTFWLARAEMTEWVVSQTVVPALPEPVSGVIERTIVVRNVDRAAFERP